MPRDGGAGVSGRADIAIGRPRFREVPHAAPCLPDLPRRAILSESVDQSERRAPSRRDERHSHPRDEASLRTVEKLDVERKKVRGRRLDAVGIEMEAASAAHKRGSKPRIGGQHHGNGEILEVLSHCGNGDDADHAPIVVIVITSTEDRRKVGRTGSSRDGRDGDDERASEGCPHTHR